MSSSFQEIHIKNVHQVNEWLYRGGQPDEVGLRDLYNHGVRAVISFRWRKSVNIWEREACERIGLKFYSIPLNYMTVPKAHHIDEFFNLLDEMSNRSVFVHCFHGSDRTGLMVGIYRIARDGWSVTEAYKEMKACGFHRFRIRPFKWCLWQYYAAHLKSQKSIDTL
jgi:protein tyrosine/serine phosphatase